MGQQMIVHLGTTITVAIADLVDGTDVVNPRERKLSMGRLTPAAWETIQRQIEHLLEAGDWEVAEESSP